MIGSIMFHYFHNNDTYKKVQGSLSGEEFEKIINNSKYKIISIDEWISKYKKNKLDNEVFLSFDDGLKEQYDIALDILNKYKIKVLWNINTNPTTGGIDKLELYRYYRNYFFKSIDEFYNYFFQQYNNSKYNKKIEININEYLKQSSFYTYNDRKFRYIRDVILCENYHEFMEYIMRKSGFVFDDINLWLSEKEIENIVSQNHFIGLHTHNHPTNIDKFNFDEQYEEYYKNKEILEKITKNKIQFAAYPCGKYNSFTIDVMKKLNIDFGLIAHPEYKNSKFEIGRIDCSDILKEIRKNENNSIY